MHNNSWHVRGHFCLLAHAHCDMAEHEKIGVVLRKGMDYAIASFKPQYIPVCSLVKGQ